MFDAHHNVLPNDLQQLFVKYNYHHTVHAEHINL